ncbi:MAG: LPS assembly protein LptD [Candidatus Sulfotelmatobacter sp.]
MSLRNRFLITAACLCHLLLALPLVTSQLRSSDVPPALQTSKPAKSDATQPSPCAMAAQSEASDSPTICAIEQEKDGSVYKLHGAVEIHYGSYVLKADEATYNSDTDEATANGHFALDGGPNDDHIRASRGTYNLSLETGRFYDVTGTVGIRFRGNRVIATAPSSFAFNGKLVEKTSPDYYLVSDGMVTTCEMPRPKWQFNARKVVVDVGGNARIYRSTFLLHGFPVLYFPFVTHPVERDARESGFLMPSVGRSTAKGYIVGDAFYWAINRMMDATAGAEYLSLRGWSQRGEFRAHPSETSYVDLNYFGVVDRGIGSPPVRQGGQNARLNAEDTFGNFRAVANIDYLTSFLFRLAFNEVFSQAVYSEVKSQAFLSKSTDGFNLSGFVERYQNFLSTTPGDVITISHAPSLDFSSIDRPLWHTPFYWSVDASGTGLARSEPGVCSAALNGRSPVCTQPFRTGNLLGRFDLNPEISLPLWFRGWSFRPELILHDTYYTARLGQQEESGFAARGIAVSNPINRQALETAAEVRPPALERVFGTEFLGRKWKHVIEPRVAYRFVTGVNNFSNTLRFDERDLLTDTHEVEYGLVTRLYARRTASKPEDCLTVLRSLLVGGPAPEARIPWQRPDPTANPACPAEPPVRELVTWELAQKYFIDPTFGGAVVAGQRNVFATSVDLTGIAFITEPRRLSPLVSRLRVETSAHTDAEWDLDYDFQQGRASASTLLANYHVGPVTVGGGDAILQIPAPVANATPRFNQFRAALGYGQLNKRGFTAATSFGFDAETRSLQFATAQTTYNWDCCGLTLEYRRYAIANVRDESLYSFTFSLANIGSFGNLRRPERLY